MRNLLEVYHVPDRKKRNTTAAGVKFRSEGDKFIIEGPKGTLSTPVPAGIKIEVEDSVLRVTRAKEDKDTMALHGLTELCWLTR